MSFWCFQSQNITIHHFNSHAALQSGSPIQAFTASSSRFNASVMSVTEMTMMTISIFLLMTYLGFVCPVNFKLIIRFNKQVIKTSHLLYSAAGFYCMLVHLVIRIYLPVGFLPQKKFSFSNLLRRLFSFKLRIEFRTPGNCLANQPQVRSPYYGLHRIKWRHRDFHFVVRLLNYTIDLI